MDERLKSIVERIERLEEEKSGIASDIRDIYKEAKCSGYDTKALRAVIKLRSLPERERDYNDSLIQAYRDALEV